jgi:hypothetical protein
LRGLAEASSFQVCFPDMAGRLPVPQALRTRLTTGARLQKPSLLERICQHSSLDADSKLIVVWLVGNHDAEAANAFMLDAACRLASRVQLTTTSPAIPGSPLVF